MTYVETRLSQILLVDPGDELSPEVLEQFSTPFIALRPVSSPAAARRMIDQGGFDLVVLVIPVGPCGDGERSLGIGTLVLELIQRRPLSSVLVTSVDELRRRPAALFTGVRTPSSLPALMPRKLAAADRMRGIIGDAPATRRMRHMIERVAPSDRPVLVVGPTGTGKELAVEAIHRLGRHPEAPLLDLNCGAIPDTLMESLLFGHARGAFTGADQQQEGYLGAVGKGTLFLDEIAELPVLLQSKLLRVLETRKYRRLGSTEERTFHGRIVAATHADLLARAAERRFREDLYYRLAVLVVDVPPLDDRREDIPALVEHFAGQQDRPLNFSSAAMTYLQAIDWPGNIRQLRNAIDRLAVTTDVELIDVEALRRYLRPEHYQEARLRAPQLHDLASVFLRTASGDKLAAAQDLLIEAAMREFGGNKSAAARALGVHRKVLERRLARDDRSGENGGSHVMFDREVD
ncbi:sigma 54-interacting transcriptional regulator [Nannocystis pusilla]|uniref:Sigma-54 dependent transcriptional regulator n=1 Tax=Nannocystis pusilla TaxID=889268 RepID=A0ABS7U0A3_9BACT|nr:sigma-54 dependent transcriptional regulator [Nannocystis pusilla]MBZ5713885.1 sigma-54 dependent transcriptional regulator [Nannocystis pusilla]